MTTDYIDHEAGRARESGAARVGNEGLGGAQRTATARYKFSEDGGATGAHELAADLIPAGAIVTGGRADVITPLASAGAATIALGLEGPADLQAATSALDPPWSEAGITPLAGADTIKTAAPRRITATIGAFALTAGEFVVYLDYLDTRTSP